MKEVKAVVFQNFHSIWKFWNTTAFTSFIFGAQ
jgi:hypothetical protein